MRAKILSLQKEIEELKPKLMCPSDVQNLIKESVSLNEFRDSIKTDLPELLKIEREQACHQIFATLQESSKGLIEEVKKTRTYANAAAQPPSLFAGRLAPPPTRPAPNDEGVLLAKPKNDNFRDFESNKKVLLGIIEGFLPDARIRGTGRIFGGGVRISCSNNGEAITVREVLQRNGTRDICDNFDFIIPNKKKLR